MFLKKGTKMKKILILCFIGGISYNVFADNLQPAVSCKGVAISMSTPETTLEANCQAEKVKDDIQITNGQSVQKVKNFTSNDGIQPEDNDLSKIKFTADDGTRHICYYKNNILKKCKLIK